VCHTQSADGSRIKGIDGDGDQNLDDKRGKRTTRASISDRLGLSVFRSQTGPTHCKLNNVSESFTSCIQPTFIHSFQTVVNIRVG